MYEERENYCKLLGLNPYKMKEYTDEDINNRIQAMEDRWDHEAKNASISKGRKIELTEYLRLIPDIRSTMDSPVLREEEFENAKKYLMDNPAIAEEIDHKVRAKLGLIPTDEPTPAPAKSTKSADVDK